MSKGNNLEIEKEVAKFFDDSSLLKNNAPKIIIVTGGNAAGKTTFIKNNYSKGYVIINAEEIYRNIKIFDEFGSESQKLVNEIGENIANKAIRERRNIVLEMIGHEQVPLRVLIDAMLAVGYKVSVELVTADIKESYKWHLKAVEEDKGYLPTHHTEDLHRAWILDAIKK